MIESITYSKLDLAVYGAVCLNVDAQNQSVRQSTANAFRIIRFVLFNAAAKIVIIPSKNAISYLI